MPQPKEPPLHLYSTYTYFHPSAQDGKDYIPLDTFFGGESTTVLQQDYRDTNQRKVNHG